MGDSNCYTCDYCLSNCTACPDGNITSKNGGDLYTLAQGCSVLTSRRKRIWNQSRMSSSMGLLKRKSMMVSKQVGQCANPTKLLTSGGPGDLAASMQKSNYLPAVGKAPCYNMGRLRNRTAYKNNRGVDRKHGSYQRHLARRVGGVLRAEKMPHVMNKTAYVGQPRTRTGTRCDCNKKLTTKKCLDDDSDKDKVCCHNRIPTSFETLTNCYMSPSAKRTCVAGSCRCCGK
jgi:hypothetical protein